jgi:hypothetical protein
MARFFHPSAKIREKWPQNDKQRLFGVLVMGEGIRRVQHKDQMCYLVDSTIFHIVKKNFKILGAPAIPFDSERPGAMRVDPAPVPVPWEAVNPDQIADRNIVPNIEGYSARDLLRGDIEEQRRQGITVDDDNEPLPENARIRGVDNAKGLLPKERRLCVSQRQVREQALGRDCQHVRARPVPDVLP